MSDVKQYRDYDYQINKLISHGCIIADREFCLQVLTDISYYRLSAYFLPYIKKDKMYSEDTEFNKIFSLYEFDRKLRNLIFASIEVVEISLRARLSYFHSSKYGPLGYLDSSTFNSKHNHDKFIAKIEREIDSNKKVLFVKHHIDNYNGQFPLWVISELFTFGMLSYFYTDLTTADKKEFAGKYFNETVSWLRCCTDLRNICAHYGRLYFRKFSAMPAGFDIPESTKRRLWGTMLALRSLYPSVDKWNSEFMPAIEALFEEYKETICLHHVGFPVDWVEKLKK